jgi:hypothetical protein
MLEQELADTGEMCCTELRGYTVQAAVELAVTSSANSLRTTDENHRVSTSVHIAQLPV